MKHMRPFKLLVSTIAVLTLALTSHAALTTMDWKFSLPGNPTALDTNSTSLYGGGATATFYGTNNTYYPGTAPGGSNGYYGSPTGLWDMNDGHLLLTLGFTSFDLVDLTLVITHFVDGQAYPGMAIFSGNGLPDSNPNYTGTSRTVVIPQWGNMGGFWAADTYTWSQVSLDVYKPFSIDIIPGNGYGGEMLLDEVQFTITGGLWYLRVVPAFALSVDPHLGIGINLMYGWPYPQCRLEYRNSLTSGSWLPLCTTGLHLGMNYVLPGPLTNGPAAFYRAVWVR
jgi:hypothetical protein